MKHFLLLSAIMLLSFVQAFSQTTLLTEGFETDGEGSRYTSTTFSDCTSSDYFLRTNDNGPFSSCGSFGSALSNVQGSWFWVAEDIESTANPNATFSTLTLNPLNASGYSSITVSLYMATGRTGTQWEWGDSIKIQTSWDGGSYTTIGQFVGDGEFGGFLRQDTNLDGVADPGASDIPATFTNFTFNVPGIGTNLRVRVRLCGLDGSEEFAFDQIVVQGSSTPPSNYAPVLASIESENLLFTEGDGPLQVSNTITVSDIDDTDLAGAVVSICSGFNTSEDVLSFSPVAGIGGIFDPSTGILTFTGTASLASYQSILRSVAYQNTNTTNPSNSAREICFTVNDGTDDSNTLSRTINIMDVINDEVCIPFAESFETDGEGITYVSNTFNDSPSPEFFFRTNTQPTGHAESVTGIDGSYFWASEDVMSGSNGITPGIIEFAPMTITGNSSFAVSISMGTSNSNGTRWEKTDNIYLQYNIDGAGWNTFGLFEGDDEFGGDLRVDLDNDPDTVGGGGPYGDVVPNGSVSDFDFNFTGSGDVMKIRIMVEQDGGSEELVFDNIRVSGNVTVPALCKDISIYLDNTGNASIVPSDISLNVLDACGADSLAASATDFTCDSIGDRTVVLTVFDAVGNTSTCTATVTVLDTIPPAPICINGLAVELDSTGMATVYATDLLASPATEACGPVTYTLSDSVFTCDDLGTNIVQLSANDASGNSDYCEVTVLIEENLNIALTCPSDQVVSIDNNCEFILGDYRSLATAWHPCGIDSLRQVPAAGTPLGLNDTLVTITAFSGAKSTSCTFNISLDGVNADFISDIDTGCVNSIISFTDNSYGGTTWLWDFGDGSPMESLQNPVHKYEKPGTYSVKLIVGNTNGCIDSIVKQDFITIHPPKAKFTLAPSIGCSIPHTVFFTDQSILSDTWFWDFGDSNTSTAQNPIHTYTQYGTYKVLLTVTDTIFGCQDTISAIVVVDDNQPPTILCPGTQMVYSDENCLGKLDDFTSLITVSDLCDPNPVVTQSPTPGTLFSDSIDVTIFASDAAGNIDSCKFTVITIDTVNPQSVCQDLSVFLDSYGQATISATEVDNGSTDNCSIDSMWLDKYDFNCSELGTNNVTLFVSDASGNIDSCMAAITVNDNVKPIAVCKNITVNLGQSGTASITAAQLDGGSSDNCSIDSMWLNRYDFTMADLGIRQVTLFVADASGNESSCTASVKVVDNTPPMAQCNTISIYLDDDGKYIFSDGELLTLSAGSSDNVTASEDLVIEAEIIGSRINCTEGEIYVYTEIYVSDENGNTDKCGTWVKVLNGFDLLASQVKDIEVTAPAGTCETTIDYPKINTESTCAEFSLLSGLGPNGMFPVGTTEEKWLLTNPTGDSLLVSFLVTVTADNLPPTLDMIANIDTTGHPSQLTIPLTGISYGADCAEQSIAVTASGLNSDVVSSIAVNYTSPASMGELQLTLAPNAMGSDTITVSVEDSEGGITTQSFVLTVNYTNQAPMVMNAIADQEVNAGQVIKIPFNDSVFVDYDGDSLLIEIALEGNSTLPAWLQVMNDTLYATPSIADTGCISVVITATDPSDVSVSDTFNICVDGFMVGTNEIGLNEMKLNLFPNPSKGLVTLEFDAQVTGDVEVLVTDISDKQILKKSYMASQRINFNLSEQVSGMYLVNVKVDGQHYMRKLILNRR
ncbi:PKD domain-containing protein [Maribellus sediminis]|uniref:PKD domain-containing protein n=1 Tax=Maribellus sediminis TaxID=2696285 RepID=UPI0014303443|nr:PKD domain-containing protein [Maribellus sediminis]